MEEKEGPSPLFFLYMKYLWTINEIFEKIEGRNEFKNAWRNE